MRRGRNYKLVGRRKQLFLEALAARGNMTAAAHAAGVSRACAYLNRQNDDTFAKAWEEAEEIAADRLEAEAWRRGVEGVEEPVISLGKVVEGADGEPLMIRRYSDTVLLALLRAHRPEKYRERNSVEIDVSEKLWERLEAARQRAIATSDVAAAPRVLELQPAAVQTSTDLVPAEHASSTAERPENTEGSSSR